MTRAAAARARRPVRRIAVITGTRAEYGLLRSVMEAIRRRRGLRLQVVVTGMHLLRKFGHTIDDIRRGGWHVDAQVKMQVGNDGALDQATGLSRGVSGIARYLEQARTDIVVVLGDRIEAMAGALAAVTTGRFVAHIHGGDLAPGDFDESLRNAITKLAHLHLTATCAARQRIIRMGECAGHVHWVGAPGLDRLMLLARHVERSKRGSRRALIVQHACGRSPAYERRVMSALLRVVDKAGLIQTIIYPNTDRGHRGIIEAIETHRKRAAIRPVQVVRSLPRDAYLSALIEAEVLVGNSSSGVIEAGTAGTPCVNIGARQNGRERSGRSVVDAAESVASIRAGLTTALRKRPIIGNPSVYGNGRAGLRIADLLASMPLDERRRHKCDAPQRQ